MKEIGEWGKGESKVGEREGRGGRRYEARGKGGNGNGVDSTKYGRKSTPLANRMCQGLAVKTVQMGTCICIKLLQFMTVMLTNANLVQRKNEALHHRQVNNMP